jgi:hypothetical protein
MSLETDDDEYRLLTQSGAGMTISLSAPFEGLPVIHLLGNREGMLSLANVLLWLHANSFRREFLSVTALPFVQSQGMISLSIRVLMESDKSDYGRIQLMDLGQQFEWSLSEDDLKVVGLTVHRLACFPEHGYERLPVTQRGTAWVLLELLSNRLHP